MIDLEELQGRFENRSFVPNNELLSWVARLSRELVAARKLIDTYRQVDNVYPHNCKSSETCYLCKANDAYDEVVI